MSRQISQTSPLGMRTLSALSLKPMARKSGVGPVNVRLLPRYFQSSYRVTPPLPPMGGRGGYTGGWTPPPRTRRIEEIIRGVTQRELNLIVNLGYLLGAVIGTMTFIGGQLLRG